jgi:hypothetical protein
MSLEFRQTTSECVGLSLLVERFPQEQAVLHRLFQKDPSFQFLCADYRDCLAALQHWQESTLDKALDSCALYAGLLKELEQEVQQYLDGEIASGTGDP